MWRLWKRNENSKRVRRVYCTVLWMTVRGSCITSRESGELFQRDFDRLDEKS